MKDIPNITLVIGTRPEAIKLAPLILSIKESKLLKCRVLLTGQHLEMVSQVMKLFNIEADHNLNIMKENQTLASITSSSIEGLNADFEKFKPDLVLVQGDTTSALSGALAAFYQKIPIGHIEAGLRTNLLMDPFPEEVNRRLIAQMASLHFAPTIESKKNLIKNGVMGEIFHTGNTVIDALYIAVKKESKFGFEALGLENKKFILATLHRRENWGKNIEYVASAINSLLDLYPTLKVLLPMHKNQKLRNTIIKNLGNNSRVILTEPLDYIDLVAAIKKSILLITDSGGLQEEAPALGKPVFIIREKTERPEALIAGTAKLVGTKTQTIVKEVSEVLDDEKKYNSMSRAINPFGDGKSSQRIVNICLKFLDEIY